MLPDGERRNMRRCTGRTCKTVVRQPSHRPRLRRENMPTSRGRFGPGINLEPLLIVVAVRRSAPPTAKAAFRAAQGKAHVHEKGDRHERPALAAGLNFHLHAHVIT